MEGIFSVTYSPFENARDKLIDVSSGLDGQRTELSKVIIDVNKLYSLENKGYSNRLLNLNRWLEDVENAIQEMSSKLEQIRDLYRDTESINLQNLNEKIQPENSRGFSNESRRSAEHASLVASESLDIDQKSNDGVFVTIGSLFGIKTITTEKTYHNKHTITHDKDKISDDAKDERVAFGTEKETKWGILTIGESTAVGTATAGYAYDIGKGKVSGEVDAAKHEKHVKVGTEKTYIKGGIEGIFGKAEAKGSVDNTGVELKAGADPVAVKGNLETKIFGLKIDADITASAGAQAGGTGKIHKHSGGISGKLGIDAIIGLDVDIKVDWTDTKGYKARFE